MMEHRRRLERLSQLGSVNELKDLFDAAQAELERKLMVLARKSGNKFTAHSYRMLLAQVRQSQLLLARQLVGGLDEVTRTAQVEGLRSLIQDINKLETHFTGAEVPLPIEEAGRFRGVIDGRRESLLRGSEKSVAKYTSKLVTQMEDDISLAMMTGDDMASAVGRVMNTAQNQWWQAERIVRTEVIGAYNAAQHDGIMETQSQIPDIMMRWTENVDDLSYTPLDDRVSEDSIAMHGQVAPAGGFFYFPNTMPGGGPLTPDIARFTGQSWTFPPMRPNDRAALMPWRSHWGIPAWKWQGMRVPMTP